MTRTQTMVSGLVCVGAVLLATSILHAAGACAFIVNDESGVDAPWPLVGGLPLPEGAVRGSNCIRVLDAKGGEVPAQVDVAATYRDGSVRWALLSLMGSSKDEYRAEFGTDVKRTEAQGIKVAEKDGAIEINTGAAVFTVSKDSLLVETAALLAPRKITLWGKGGNYAYLIDNQGRTAKCAGGKAEIELSTLKSGPLRYVIRTEGWYVTDRGERVARGVARMSFFAGSAMIQISHTLIFTEDTNKIWVRDYGIMAPVSPGSSSLATFDVSKAFDKNARTVELKQGQSASMVQDDFPHFANTESHFSLSLISDGKTQELLSGAACGEWCDLSSKNAGMTVVVRDLAEQFPKELEATPDGIRIHLWSARCGREWDFRAPVLVKEYWGQWALQYGNASQLAKTPGNAQGSAKTHEFWLMPHAGAVDVQAAAKQAHAACRPVLLQADPGFLCASGAMTWPIYPKDEKRFPAEEAVISDFFDRTMLPFRVFPMTGLIEWGSCPYLNYVKKEGKWGADFYRTSGVIDYGLRRQAWNLYARSGERKYYEYAARFNNFCADWNMAHLTFGDVRRGGFPFAYNLCHEPFHWRGPKSLTQVDNSGQDVVNWLLDYYLTGSEQSLEATCEYGDGLKREWDKNKAGRYSQSVILRVLSALYMREWDPAFKSMMNDQIESVIDLDAPTGLSEKLNMNYGPLYKMDRTALALYDYYWATGDERAKQAFLKVMDFVYRFNRVEPPTYYQNAAAFLFSIAYEWTGRGDYQRLVNFLLKVSVRQERKPLAEELKGVTDLNILDKLPYRAVNANMNYMIGMPAALSVVAKEKRTIPPWPMIGRYLEGSLYFNLLTCGSQGYFPPHLPPEEYGWSIAIGKPAGTPVELGIFIEEPRPNCAPVSIIGPDGAPAKADIRIEERIPYYKEGEWTAALHANVKAGLAVPPPLPLHVRAVIPAEAPPGIYRVTSSLKVVVVQDANVDKISLDCPDGFWLDPYGMPLYFDVPQGLDQLKLFTTRPVTILRPDGTTALDEENGKVGEVSVPVEGKGGAWCVMDRFRTPLYAATPHIRLLNVPSIVASMPGQLLQVPLNQRPESEGWTAPSGDFVEGMIGPAIHLTNGRSLTFPRGEKLVEGGYQHFPASQGTIEFWFRPDRSSTWLTSKETGDAYVRAGSVIKFNYGNNLTLSVSGSSGVVKDRKPAWAGTSSPGYYLRAGEWVHLAAAWNIQDGKGGTTGDFALFINGHRQPWTPTWLSCLDGKATFTLGEIATSISVGCHEGSLDELRVSRVARYNKDFEPPRQPFSSDAATAALFHFDGNTNGVSGADAGAINAQ